MPNYLRITSRCYFFSTQTPPRQRAVRGHQPDKHALSSPPLKRPLTGSRRGLVVAKRTVSVWLTGPFVGRVEGLGPAWVNIDPSVHHHATSISAVTWCGQPGGVFVVFFSSPPSHPLTDDSLVMVPGSVGSPSSDKFWFGSHWLGWNLKSLVFFFFFVSPSRLFWDQMKSVESPL